MNNHDDNGNNNDTDFSPSSLHSQEIDPEMVKIIRLSSGEQIIAAILNETQFYINTFIPCATFHEIPMDENGEIDFENISDYEFTTLAPWSAFSDMEYAIPIYKHHVVSISRPTIEFRDAYVDAVNEIIDEYSNNESDETTAIETDDDATTTISESSKSKEDTNSQKKATVTSIMTKNGNNGSKLIH